ncbi:MAG: class I SAM-dependent methyltransferase [Candidatus Aegiribacteria sp.]|nr:class I SAM-dependent methyltransferase [Candidatus Aegiribacteria sp.]
MIKADYRKIASFYDRGRSLSAQNTTLWFNLISKLSGASKGARMLDLGCGTGRFSLPMTTSLGFNVTGVDSSAEMLAKAKQKDSNCKVNWVLADAGALTFPGGSFDVVFLSHLLHHVDSPFAVLKECNRVLAPSGVVLIRYGAMDQIRSDVEHTFFPQVTEIDEPRTPTRELMERWLLDAGFVGIFSEEVVQQTYQTGMAHLDAARARSTSVLSMISEISFQAGIHSLAEHVAMNPEDEWVLFDKMTLTAGHKRKSQ